MFVKVIAQLFVPQIADAISIVQDRIDAYRDPSGGCGLLVLVDITAKNPGVSDPFVVTATVDAQTASHAASAVAVSRALNPVPKGADPTGLTVIEVQVREKK